MKKILIVLFILWISAVCWSQDRISLSTEEYGDLKISDLEINCIINGRLSQTELTITFYNHTDRILSGELYIPLPEGAAVNGYALDVNGKMIDGVIVQKDKGRQVFETIQRQGIDPGLLEKVSGNNFKTRVFPLPARGYRTVRIGYINSLYSEENRLIYSLPLPVSGAVNMFSLNIEVVKAAAAPAVISEGLKGIEKTAVRDSYIISTEKRNSEISGSLKVILPDVKINNLIVEKGPDGYSYFTYFKETESIENTSAGVPENITLYWDASSSMDKDKTAKALAFLKEVISRWKDTTVYLVVMRDNYENHGEFVIKDGDSSILFEHLEKLDYDGGTAIKSFPILNRKISLAVLISDGINNFGSSAASLPDVPLYTAAVGNGADYSYMKYLAKSTGGVYVNLDSGSMEDAVEDFINPQPAWSTMSTDIKNIFEMYPAFQTPERGLIIFSGKFTGEAYFTILKPDGTNEKVFLSDRFCAEGNLARTFFGQKKIDEILLNPETSDNSLLQAGREYSLVTPDTSFIVLDSAEQYLQYEIAPPESMPEWRRYYFDQIQMRENEKEQTEKQKIEQILALWQQRKDWWNTEFIYDENSFAGKDMKEDAPSEEPMASANRSSAMDDEDAMLYSLSEETEEYAGEFDEAMDGSGMVRTGETEKKAKGEEENQNRSIISINEWNPETPYLKEMEKSSDPYKTYLEFKEEYETSPSFYLDCGDFFEKRDQPDTAVRIWSNIAEMELENPQLLRNLGHRLQQTGRYHLSESVFRKVLELRPEEPQSYRDLALVLVDLEKYEEAVELLYKVAVTPWARFYEIELIALTEMNSIIAGMDNFNVHDYDIDQRFIKNLDCDVRIILTWDADLTDMDLWVTEPSGEKAYYGNRSTIIGGNFSRDFTEGYGPEEYLLKKAMSGLYKIEVNYYSSQALTLSGTVTLQIDVFTDYGRSEQRKESITVRLKEQEEVLLIGEIEF